MRRYAGETQRRFHIPIARQILDLLNLSLLHGIPPVFYYAYGLYGQPHERWLHYVYTHELPHWHTVMCGQQELSAANRILSDKQAFALEMAKAGIPTPETIAYFPRSAKMTSERIFLGQSFFCKPNTGNQGKGCFELLYDRMRKDYRVIGEEVVEGEAAVLSYFQRKVDDCDYIVQPLLVNHPQIRRWCSSSRLATIRLITGHGGRKPVCIGAVLEMPRSGEQMRWRLMPVDCQSGMLMPDRRQEIAFLNEGVRPPDLTGKAIPCWEDVLNLCLRAHEYLPALAAVGWDVAVTPSGVILIEGNFNWRIDSLQTVSGVPLLTTRLLGIYASRLWSNPTPPSNPHLDCRDT